jgi:hypothetical protein
LILFGIDLAKEQGQDETIIPFEGHNRLSTIIGSSSKQSVIDIRELQFEQCLSSNHRKEVIEKINLVLLRFFFVVDRYGRQSIMIHRLWLKYLNYGRIHIYQEYCNMKLIK